VKFQCPTKFKSWVAICFIVEAAQATYCSAYHGLDERILTSK
jgi:hypothetical protein